MSEKPNVLFVDDDALTTRALLRSLQRLSINFKCHFAANPEEALLSLQNLSPEVAVVDLSLDECIGPESGLSLIESLITKDSTLRILVLTGHGRKDYGLRALQLGAASFLNKPVEPTHLLALIEDGIATSILHREYQKLTSEKTQYAEITGLTSRNSEMQEVIETVAYAGSSNQPVLILGETGTGKGVIAQAIHRTAVQQRGRFIRFQPGFGSQDLINSELFGHIKGAFTGATEDRRGLVEEANGGTLFIDEVDELPNETQVTLLHVLQEQVFRPVGSSKELRSDFRLLTATNRPLEELLQKGKIREDFYHRIAHLTIELPPLRERTEDISDLAENFLRQIVTREKLPVQGFTGEALVQLCRSRWPGNIRELQAIVEGSVYRANFENRRFVTASDLQLKRNGLGLSRNPTPFREQVKNFEVQLIQESLAKNNNNQSRTSRELQLDRSTLRRILERAT